jgi:hypothetical protein
MMFKADLPKINILELGKQQNELTSHQGICHEGSGFAGRSRLVEAA